MFGPLVKYLAQQFKIYKTFKRCLGSMYQGHFNYKLNCHISSVFWFKIDISINIFVYFYSITYSLLR